MYIVLSIFRYFILKILNKIMVCVHWGAFHWKCLCFLLHALSAWLWKWAGQHANCATAVGHLGRRGRGSFIMHEAAAPVSVTYIHTQHQLMTSLPPTGLPLIWLSRDLQHSVSWMIIWPLTFGSMRSDFHWNQRLSSTWTCSHKHLYSCFRIWRVI